MAPEHRTHASDRIARREALTPRQRDVLDVIRRGAAERGRPPTLREIGAALGVASTNAVRDHLQALQEKGYLRREGRSARGLQLVGPAVRSATPGTGRSVRAERGPSRPEVVRVPVVGRVAAGQPVWAEQHVEQYLTIDREVVRDGDTFALRVHGDSMRDAGILDGDYVFVRQQTTAQPRDIVVALIGDETTVKRFVPAGDTIRLEPENPAYQPLVFARDDEHLSIVGRVSAVLRTIR